MLKSLMDGLSGFGMWVARQLSSFGVVVSEAELGAKFASIVPWFVENVGGGSKKMSAFIASLSLAILTVVIPAEWISDQMKMAFLDYMTKATMAYLVGQGMADLGKERVKEEAKGMAGGAVDLSAPQVEPPELGQ